jgi:Zn-dependent protease with chaperone function/Tfp pilus assembly major pilin PilA
MDTLIHPREKTLGMLTLVLGILAWLLIIVGTFGGALIGLGIGFLFYLFAHSALIAYLKGNGIQVTDTQYPDLYAQVASCCDRLKIAPEPRVYLLSGNGMLNAFATQFLNKQYVVLLSDIVGAMDDHPEGVRFYIGHELGHLRMKHQLVQLFRWPVLWLPLLGAAYSRARESTCDRHGRACCASAEGAARALAVLATGPKRWKTLDLPMYLRQTRLHKGFWASLHELTSAYPWLGKRVARVQDPEVELPARNPFAYVFAAFVPYAGRMGARFGLLIGVCIVGVLVAVALPAYQDYVTKARLTAAVINSKPAREALTRYYIEKEEIPVDLSMANIPTQLAQGASMTLNPDDMVLSVKTTHGTLLFIPAPDNTNQRIRWTCQALQPLRQNVLPQDCTVAPSTSQPAPQ